MGVEYYYELTGRRGETLFKALRERDFGDIVEGQAGYYMKQGIPGGERRDTDSLNTIYNELVTIAFMPKLTASDVEKLIHQVVQTIHQINQLPFDTARGREIMDGYLRVMEGAGYSVK